MREEFLRLVEEVLEKIGFKSVKVAVSEREMKNKKKVLSARIDIREGQNYLIGQHGANLAALQHIIRSLGRKLLPKDTEVMVDINNYYEEKKQFLIREAKEAAHQALRTGMSVPMRPMLSYERKIVHALFSEDDHVTTESIGQGEDRKILVKPKSLV